ncbi:MAG: hypothetical protein RBS39_03610 [Phycisphaerales bacterium]|nr:hypothetical protein [Phycisphaerales bacterium]
MGMFGVRVAAACVAGCAGLASAQDVIELFNGVYQDAIRNETPGALSANAGPGAISRAGAMMHVAMFNAVNAGTNKYESYGSFEFAGANDASRQVAAAVAAHQVISSLYTSGATLAQSQAALNSVLASVPDGQAKTRGIQLGQASASHIMQLRAGDGWNNTIPYTPGSSAGDWVPTQPGDPVHPHWGNVTPWGIQSGDQFRPNRLASYGTMENFLASQEYADNFNDVKENGRIDRWTPADEEYQVAFFWGNDRYGTYKPPGHLNNITREFIDREWAGLGADERLEKSSRLFALLNIAMADAGIAAWDCKYNTEFDLWRPITGIRNADLDGNPLTLPDENWEPLNHVDPDGDGPMTADPFSPNFPAYMSGHATFGAAHAAIMREFFGGDSFDPMLFSTDDPYVEGLLREFASWEDMARENGRSRIYLGVHWQVDADDGYLAGTGAGEWIYANYLRAIPSPGGLALLGVGGLVGLRRRR